MNKEARILSQRKILNPVPLISRGTTNTTTDYFINLKDYVLLHTGELGRVFLLKKSAGVVNVIKTIPWTLTNHIPYPVGGENAYVTKDGTNAGITIHFIIDDIDETAINVCVSTASSGVRNGYAVDVIGKTVYVAVMEGASCFLYTGTINVDTHSISFVKKTVLVTTLSTGANKITTFTMFNDTTFQISYQANGTTINKIYTINGATISDSGKTYIPSCGQAINDTDCTPVLHVTGGIWSYDKTYKLYYVDAATCAITVTLQSSATYNNKGCVFIDDCTEGIYNLAAADGYHYSVKYGGIYNLLTTNGVPIQTAAKANYYSDLKFGPIILDTLFMTDPFNAYNYISMPVKVVNSVINSANKQVPMYTNNTAAVQYITGITIASLPHNSDLNYYLSADTLLTNSIGVAIDEKTLYRANFAQSDVRTFANCPIALTPGSTVFLDVVNSFGDITLTLIGIRDDSTCILKIAEGSPITVYTDAVPPPGLTDGTILQAGTVLHFVCVLPTAQRLHAFYINGEVWDIDKPYTTHGMDLVLSADVRIETQP